ncbi:MULTISPECIES: PAP/fibrillin family protein [unclassified Moorena]|uniref:PAP/fibrillin family protein n=1 Tax=unclassified Moorena TaxID=2683338 RepID=UPI001401570F|nr:MULTISPECIES: PAP/fibrillin family protein [unclassified Moorena]NEO15666.1 fimbrial protein [Moorena sp. SIO3E8]NEQ02089.1 fimbrial protein [Moorena sp. SIO3F7]
MVVVDSEKRTSAKTALRQVLAACGGNTKDEAVIAAINHLSQLNPTTTPTRHGELLDNEWLLISAPNFPGGEQLADGQYAYTLGRLAFNMFQPTGLKLVIDRVLQPVFLLGDGQQRSYDIVVEFTTVDESMPQIRGIVRNKGVCYPVSDWVLQVQFTGGILAPHPSTNLKDWQAIFADQSPSSQKSLTEKLMSGFLKLMFGLVPPQGMNRDTGEVAFTMKRSPKGRLQILYLDEELRIVRGEKGTVLVCDIDRCDPSRI